MEKKFLRRSSAGVAALIIQEKELTTLSFRKKEELSNIMTNWNRIFWGTGIKAHIHVKHHHYECDE